ncbi:hypothetical protein CTheo_3413 [Ceratobasidium theobromae]|uniref:Zn(2)-C6 fungal-type domain-containing protein n=1 Tax=Ceratobasidium theobromae TaxID=1582974 RepID=A0A5N5QNL0_9AGAM|nr:hypothetical protein CTheo_3413 [Ceratobasidium theobromae]
MGDFVITTRTNCQVLPRHSACLVCRKRKQKCDAAKPECTECLNANRNCQYEDDTPQLNCNTWFSQERIKELEEQIRTAEENQSRSPLSATSSRSDTHSQSSAPGFTFGSPGSPSSVDTFPSSVGSFDAVFSGKKSLLSPTSSASSAFELNPNSAGPDPPPDVINRLLDIFMRRRGQCGFELHVGRVLQGLQPDAAEPVIPALFNAMLLVACHFAQDPGLEMWQTEYFKRTNQSIEANIQQAHEGTKAGYNSLQHLQAMLMFGIYYYFKGRLLEGHVHTAHAIRFSMALGMHKLNSRIFRRERMVQTPRQMFGMERWRPRDQIELGEAINLWWGCYDTDLAGSTLNGLPPSISFEDVTTVWPRLLSDFEHGETLPDDNYSVASLLDPEFTDIVTDATYDDIWTLTPKSYILMVYAAKLDVERLSNPQGTEEWWTRFEQCDRAINRFMATMAPVRSSRNLEELGRLVIVHTSIYCAQMQLHNAMSEFELAIGQEDPRYRNPDSSLGGLSYARCNEACRATVLAAMLIADVDMSYVNMFNGVAWVCVAEVLVREVPRLKQGGYPAQAAEKEQYLSVLEKCMGRLVATYPVLELQLKQLEALKARLPQ